MAGFVIERGGFATATALIASLADDLADNGFTIVFPESFNPTTAPYKVLLEAGADVDPLAATQPWRIMFDVQADQTCFCYVGTPSTLADTGVLPILREVVAVQSSAGLKNEMRGTDVIGNVNFKMGTKTANESTTGSQDAKISATGVWSPATTYNATTSTQAPVSDDPKFGIINRKVRIGTDSGAAFPLRYRLVVTDRGIWFGIWEDAIADSAAFCFNWVLVQRPVDRVTGAVVTDGKAPVWCVAYNGPNQDFTTQNFFYQTIVREADVLRPAGTNGADYARRRADTNADDSDGIINPKNQVALSEDGRYIITFPSRLNTNRFCYSHELDMIGVTSADVVSNGTLVPLTVYGEAEPREYLALKANSAGNTGVRLLVLNLGGGID